MKEKLTIKHIAPYLPYGLYGMFVDNKDIVTGVDCDFKIVTSLNHGSVQLENFNPILRPLSDFKKMLIGNISKELDCRHVVTMEFLTFMDGSISLNQVTVELYEVMNKSHIDYNKLIEKRLAIDINTIE